MEFGILFFLLVLSVPIFYIIGLAQVVAFFLGRSDKNHIKTATSTSPEKEEYAYLKKVLSELKEQEKSNPDKPISELVVEYQQQLHRVFSKEHMVDVVESKPVAFIKRIERQEESAKRQAPFWHHWYEQNSINLLLYIGAFLIVASAAIFVGFQWETISGVTKMSVLSLLTMLFLICGLWFYSMPKIKSAGSTFAGIAVLLIPICGIGWYNFVFKTIDVPLGMVWMITSLISLFSYICLLNYFKNSFYSYIIGLSTFSFSFSLVNMSGVRNDFYILASMVSCLMLLGFSMSYQKLKSKGETLDLQPFSTTAHILMPVSIFYGLFIATSQNALFTLETTISIFLAMFFYVMSYTFLKRAWYILAVQLLLVFDIVVFAHWQNLSESVFLYLMTGSLLVDIGLVSFFRKKEATQEVLIATVISIIKPILVFFYAIMWGLSEYELLLFSLIPVLTGLGMVYIRGKIEYLGIASLFSTISLYIIMQDILHLSDKSYILACCYILGGIGWYSFLVLFRGKSNYVRITGISSSLYFFLATIFAINYPWAELLNTITIAIIFISAYYCFSKKELIYFSNIFISFSLLNFLRYIHADILFYPFACTVLYYCFYLASMVMSEPYKQLYKTSSLAGLIITPIIFGGFSYNGNPFNDGQYYILERNSLFSAYAALVLYGLEAYTIKSRSLAYTASVIGLLTYLWQISFFGIDELQYYTLGIGIYFLGLAYFQKKTTAVETKRFFEYTGIFFLIFPTLLQSFGENGMVYSVLLGGIGIGLLLFGISLNNKRYTYAGVFALIFTVISQTYQYVFSLPRWIVVGIIGLLFLGIALYLLSRRKEAETSLKG